MQNGIQSQALIFKVEDYRRQYQMPGTGNGQKLSESLNNAQQNYLKKFHA